LGGGLVAPAVLARRALRLGRRMGVRLIVDQRRLTISIRQSIVTRKMVDGNVDEAIAYSRRLKLIKSMRAFWATAFLAGSLMSSVMGTTVSETETGKSKKKAIRKMTRKGENKKEMGKKYSRAWRQTERHR